MKETFNVTDLTKNVLKTDDVNSGIFNSNRRTIERHIKTMYKFLGLPEKTFEAPIDQLEAYTILIKEMLYNNENDDALDLLTKKILKQKKLDDAKDSENLKRLITLLAKTEMLKMDNDEKEIFERWLQDQLADNFYIESQKQLTRITNLISDDLSFFDNLTSLGSKLEFLEQYINDIRMISSLYREQVKEILEFENGFLEVISSHKEFENKAMYNFEDFLRLPPEIQDNIFELIQKKKDGKTP